MPFKFFPCPIKGLVLVEPRLFPDERGYFMETYKESEFLAAGITGHFVQDNHSLSCRGTLRGLHFQRAPFSQGKLIRVSSGSIWDVAVDLRSGSATLGKWYGLELSAANRQMFYIPEGFAHGFVALEDNTELQYKCTAEYHGPSEAGIRWDDSHLAIDWPYHNVLVSDKDALLPAWSTLVETGLFH
jgi:dTDP-4-dehydrorhamnose 3,5-epimerase